MRWWISLLVVGCAAPAHQPLTNTLAAPAAPARLSPPTLATAGRTACSLGDAVALGPYGDASAVLGFDATSGLAAWKPDAATLALQPIARDGTKLGAATSLPLAEGKEPHSIFALGGRFVVLVRRWDWQGADLRWWGVVVRADGRAGALVDLGLADLDVGYGVVTSASTIALAVGPAAIASRPAPAPRGQLLTVTGTDQLVSTPGAALSPPAPEAFRYDVTNTARPPGRGAGGTIIEAMGRPVLERTRAGTPVGEPLALVWNGNPIAHGMTVESYIAWSGTHFLYPFWADDGGPTHDRYVVRLLPIDCRP